MSFQVAGIHTQWRDSLIFETAMNSFRRNVNPRRMNEGVYLYYGHKLVLKWNNWGEEILIKSSDGVFRSDTFSIKFGDKESKLVQVHVPVPEPVEAAEEAAEESPVESPAEAPTEESPVESPAEAPTEESPVESPAEAPTEAPVEAPAEIPAEIPAEAPVEVADEAPVEAPVEVADEAPVEVAAKTPVDVKEEVPAPAPEPMPMESFNSSFQSLDTKDEPIIIPVTSANISKFIRRKQREM